MKLDWKRIILELVLQIIVELAPVSLGTFAVLAEYAVQSSHARTIARTHLVFSAIELQYEQHSSSLARCRFSAPFLA